MDLGGISKKDAKGRDNKIPIIGAVIVLVLVIIIIISIVLLLKPPASEQAGNISAVDLDGDGYKNDTDCNDNNPGINPGASINEIYEDGIDTDCDGSDLDGLKRECSTPCGKGFDYRSTEDSDKWGACDAPQPASEKCDGIDNDCDGDTDEDLQQEFGSDIGECEYGTKECRDGSWIIIENATLPVDEIFDLKDNDCDNKVDDGISYGDVCNDLYGLQRLFSWDDILENDSSTLLRFLEDYVGMGWVEDEENWLEDAEIKISNNRTAITLTHDGDSATLKLNREENKVNLESSGGWTDEYILKEEDGVLNVYGLQFQGDTSHPRYGWLGVLDEDKDGEANEAEDDCASFPNTVPINAKYIGERFEGSGYEGKFIKIDDKQLYCFYCTCVACAEL